MCLAFTILNLIDLLIEMIFAQLTSRDNDFSIMSMKTLGIEEDPKLNETGESLDESSTDNEENDKDHNKEDILDIVEIQEKTIDLQTKIGKESKNLWQIFCMSLILWIGFVAVSTKIFDRFECPQNTYL